MSKSRGKRTKVYPGPTAYTWLYLVGRAHPKDGRYGALKVGITSNPAARMKQHAADGGGLAWQHFCTSGSRALMLEIERVAIRALAAELGATVPGALGD